MNNYLFPPSTNLSNQAEKKRRIIYGAISGFAVGTICAVVSTFINTWLYPDLPIYMSWMGAFQLWLLWAGMGCILAGVAAFSAEGWFSILLSAFLMTLTTLILNFIKGSDGLLLNLVILIGLAIPFTAALMPLAYIFFWLSRRFVQAENPKELNRWKIRLVNGLVIVFLGFLPGIYARFNVRAEKGMHLIHDVLQEGAQASSVDTYPISLRKTEGYGEHKDQSYTLSQRPSSYSTVGVDVTAHFEDGYEIKCTVILYTTKDPNISPCKGITP